jgi:hypothetical protein
MSLFIDIKYVSLAAPKLERYSRKSEYLWNFRCPICGDSHKNKFKSRGYIYRRKSDLFYTCHNCGESISFGNFLKIVDPSLFREYQFERYKCENAGNVAKPDFSLVVQKPIFNKSVNDINLPTIKSLPEEHVAKKFLLDRMIPRDRLDSIYYASDFKSFVLELIPEYSKNLRDNDQRIIIPFYDTNKKLLGFQGRAIGDSKVKYITIKLAEENDKIFGLDRLDKTKRIYVVEGPFDSMFLHNSIAMMDATLYNAIPYLGNLDYTFVFDNEPRNADVCRHMKKTIDMGKNICIWPSNIDQKDINDMVRSGLTPSAVQNVIDSNTFNEARALLEFTRWKKV